MDSSGVQSPLPPVTQLVREVRGSWPGPRLGRIVVRQGGWTNLVLDADGRWIVRIPRWRTAAEKLGTEVRVLDFLSDRLRARIPRPVVIGSLNEPSGWPYVGYEKIPGTPLRSLRALPRRSQERLASFLEQLLTDLALVPTHRLRALGVRAGRPPDVASSIERLRARYRRAARTRLPTEVRAGADTAFQDLLDALARSHYRTVAAHNDLWPNHVIWDATHGRPTGVIDWEDARVGDPATDLVTLTDLDSDLLRRLERLRRRPSDHQFDRRLALYRRILPIHGCLFGLETGNRRMFESHRRQLKVSLRAPEVSG